jgi:cullin-associated NEDD8-dissociated protein 1
MASLAVGLILEKIASKDKDFRYMATSDLLNELQKDNFKLDSDTERKVSQIVLQQLDDASGDISGLAVKCLAPLVKKVSECRVVEIVDSLCQRLLTGREQQRDIASIALKTVVAEISSGSVAQCVVVSLTPKLIKGITSSVGTILVIVFKVWQGQGSVFLLCVLMKSIVSLRSLS